MELKFKDGYEYVKRMIEDYFDRDLDWTLHEKPIDPRAQNFRPYVTVDFDNPESFYLITYCDDSPRAKSLFGMGYTSVLNATPQLKMRIDAEVCEVRPTRRAKFAKDETQKGFEALFTEQSIESALEQAVEQIDDANESGKALTTVNLYLIPKAWYDTCDASIEAEITLPVSEFEVWEC